MTHFKVDKEADAGDLRIIVDIELKPDFRTDLYKQSRFGRIEENRSGSREPSSAPPEAVIRLCKVEVRVNVKVNIQLKDRKPNFKGQSTGDQHQLLHRGKRGRNLRDRLGYYRQTRTTFTLLRTAFNVTGVNRQNGLLSHYSAQLSM